MNPLVAVLLLACGRAGAAELRGPGEPCEAGASVWMTYRADAGPPGLPFTAKITSSNPEALVVPGEIAVRPSRNTLFEVTCRRVPADAVVRISVASPSPGTAEPEAIASVFSDVVVAVPPSVGGLSLGESLSDGEELVGRVALTRMAGAGGVEVRFTSIPPGLVEIAPVRVRGGEAKSEAEFRVVGRKVSRPTKVTITAAVTGGPGDVRSTTVTVVPPPEPVSFVATPSGGRLTLSRPVAAPLSLAVTSRPECLLNHPSVVIVRSGEDSVEVPFTPTVPVPVSPTEAVVSVEGGGTSIELATTFAWQGTLRFRDATKPAPPFEIDSQGTRRLTLEASPPVGSPLRVELSSASEFVNVPRYVVIESFRGGRTADVKVTASAVTEKKVATLNARANGRVTAVRIVVSPPR
ncbi:MAG: hypothetical protein JNK60_05170 [Acidobacteria bacterium]|nr:hypothetical protein [Acidobacteriota bacterium]